MNSASSWPIWTWDGPNIASASSSTARNIGPTRASAAVTSSALPIWRHSVGRSSTSVATCCAPPRWSSAVSAQRLRQQDALAGGDGGDGGDGATGGAYDKGPALKGTGPRREDLEVNARHAPGRVACRGSRLLRLVGDDRLGGQEQPRDRRGVLQRRTGHLHRVGDAGLEQILVLTGLGVQAMSGGKVAHLLGDHARLQPGVERDLLERSFQRHLDDIG